MEVKENGAEKEGKREREKETKEDTKYIFCIVYMRI
jgi:hypothetical protein